MITKGSYKISRRITGNGDKAFDLHQRSFGCWDYVTSIVLTSTEEVAIKNLLRCIDRRNFGMNWATKPDILLDINGVVIEK